MHRFILSKQAVLIIILHLVFSLNSLTALSLNLDFFAPIVENDEK